MTNGGLAIMLVSVGSILALVTYCMVRVLMLPPLEVQDLKGPLEIDTRDTSDAD